ncbi:hypothetical protein [Lacticaseibacillus saniviri]|uniref:hypothetical protein n=1 Tax=Lacticaseibacillus saniviri TaxID=931533 RepID=UPI0006CF6757|nr:hypothetical protein [Lacticaseibacillus saniviri]
MTKYLVTNGKGEFYSRQGDDYDFGASKAFATKFSTRDGAQQIAREGDMWNILGNAPDRKTHPYEVMEVTDDGNAV